MSLALLLCARKAPASLRDRLNAAASAL
eukprot:COSAG01_NODE_17277_length_1164_cov_1.226291_2_plen_27_part_01